MSWQKDSAASYKTGWILGKHSHSAQGAQSEDRSESAHCLRRLRGNARLLQGRREERRLRGVLENKEQGHRGRGRSVLIGRGGTPVSAGVETCALTRRKNQEADPRELQFRVQWFRLSRLVLVEMVVGVCLLQAKPDVSRERSLVRL